jgi:hypothetical protein
VTRCPLILQLKRTEVKKASGFEGPEEYAEFLHRKGEKFYDFNLVRKEIEE